MKVLVTGGAGYLGDATVDALEEAGHEVTVLDALLYCSIYRRPVQFVRASVVRGGRLLPTELEKADAVVWLAALVGDATCQGQPELAAAINADSVRWLAANCGNRRIIFPSTCSVYGHQDEPVNELASTEPLSVYGKTKLQAEEHLAGTDSVVFRLGTLFGLGGQHGRFRMDLVVNGMSVRAAITRTITVNGGLQWRPFLHVRDAARAMVTGLTCQVGIYNLAAENLQIKDLATKLSLQVAGLRVNWGPGEGAGGDPRNYRALTDKASRVMGWQPQLMVDAGIREVVELVAEGRLPDPEDPRFDNRASQRQTWGAPP